MKLLALHLIIGWMTTNPVMIVVMIQTRLMMRLRTKLVVDTRQTQVVFSLQSMVKILYLNRVSCSRM